MDSTNDEKRSTKSGKKRSAEADKKMSAEPDKKRSVELNKKWCNVYDNTDSSSSKSTYQPSPTVLFHPQPSPTATFYPQPTQAAFSHPTPTSKEMFKFQPSTANFHPTSSTVHHQKSSASNNQRNDTNDDEMKDYVKKLTIADVTLNKNSIVSIGSIKYNRLNVQLLRLFLAKNKI